MIRRVAAVTAVTLIVLLTGRHAHAFEGADVYHKDAVTLSIEAGGGPQGNLRGGDQSDISAVYAGARLGWVPFGTAGPSILKGAFEIGLEAIYQQYLEPERTYWAGLTALARYNFLSLGRFVPYLEFGAGLGGTNLNVREIDSDFAFMLAGGIGANIFITDSTALYLGYRMVHISNAGIESPNQGFELQTGVVGVTFFLK